MIFQTTDEFLANMKVGDSFYAVGSYIKKVQKPVGPFTIINLYKLESGILKGNNMITTDSKSLIYRDNHVNDLHRGYKITATTLEEAQTYYEEQKRLEETDLDRKLELALAQAEADELDRLNDEAMRYGQERE